MSNDMIQFGSLWVREDKNGNKYLSGSLDPEGVAALRRVTDVDDLKIMIFKNDQKGNPKAPTHRVYIARKQARGGQDRRHDRRRDRDDDVGF